MALLSFESPEKSCTRTKAPTEPLSGVPADSQKRRPTETGKSRIWQFSGMAESKEGSRTGHPPGFFPHPFLCSLGSAEVKSQEGTLSPNLHREFRAYVWRLPRRVLCVKKDPASESTGFGAAPRSQDVGGPAKYRPRTPRHSLTAPCLPSHSF